MGRGPNVMLKQRKIIIHAHHNRANLAQDWNTAGQDDPHGLNNNLINLKTRVLITYQSYQSGSTSLHWK